MELFKADVGAFFKEVNRQVIKNFGFKKAQEYVKSRGKDSLIEKALEKGTK